ncbi:PAS-domain containing protein [Falsirhodobacter sp. alg1]|uniref:PAS domain-containing protein n=1 Tax=Falsirhodobacter sp. alg1 TaxID=1472418 RepID=UPI0006937683|nr:PAS-domain containing protein [Falsirhodobacter sp. alg1]
MGVAWVDLVRIEAIAALACIAAFIGRALLTRRANVSAVVPNDEVVFLFDGNQLLDASAPARHLLSALSPQKGNERGCLITYLTSHFSDAGDQIAGLDQSGRVQLQGKGLVCLAEKHGGITRITLDGDNGTGHDILTRRVEMDEVMKLRRLVQSVPVPVWHEGQDGEITWANAAYLDRLGQSAPRWPVPHLFPTNGEAVNAAPSEAKPDWFHVERIPANDGQRTGFALSVNRAVQAEADLKEFRQTLTRTFADLPIGLAIFDQRRTLQIFNPALLDLTGLQSDFLSGRPTLFAFLDAMRANSMIPEPKDYRNWRKQMMDLEKAAANGSYKETWNLSGGQTYRVMGRPHPNGALALMFEDISSEITRTRSYRADLELGQAVLDGMSEAVAVFSPSGHLLISNTPYEALWRDEIGTTLREETATTLCARWRDATVPTELWTYIEDFITSFGPRAGGTGRAQLHDGRWLECRYSLVAGGAAMVVFTPHAYVERQMLRA